jgi:hypothetical protein
MKITTNIIYPATAAFAFACFGLSPAVRAVTPAPDGGYPNENTAEGTDALFSLTTGTGNTANGYSALYSNTAGSYNTAHGYLALFSNVGIAGNPDVGTTTPLLGGRRSIATRTAIATRLPVLTRLH